VKHWGSVLGLWVVDDVPDLLAALVLSARAQVPRDLRAALATKLAAAGIPVPESEGRWSLALEALRGVWASKYNDRWDLSWMGGGGRGVGSQGGSPALPVAPQTTPPCISLLMHVRHEVGELLQSPLHLLFCGADGSIIGHCRLTTQP